MTVYQPTHHQQPPLPNQGETRKPSPPSFTKVCVLVVIGEIMILVVKERVVMHFAGSNSVFMLISFNHEKSPDKLTVEW